MTRARNLAGLGTVTAQPTVTTPVHLGPLGVGTFSRIYGTWEHDQINSVSIGTTQLQISGITTGLNVSGIITAQNGLDITGNIVNGLNVSAGIATLQALTATTGTFTGDSTFAGTVSIAGTVTYEDITDIDSVGVGTFRKGIVVSGVSTFLSNQSGVSVTGVGSFGGDVSIADKIIHTGDTNTAVRFPSADTFTVETGGTEAIRVTSAQKVVIGDTNNDSLFAVSRAAHQLAEFINTNADATGAELYLRKDSSSPADNDALGSLNFIGDNDNSEKINYAYIQARSTDVSDGTEDGDLRFFTRGAGTLAERIQIQSDGKLLVGHTAAYGSSKAQVFNTAQYVLDLSTWSADANGPTVDFYKSRNATVGSATVVQSGDVVGRLRFLGNDGANSRTAAQITAEVDGTPGTNDMPGRLIFSTVPDDSTTVTERLRISADGAIKFTGTNYNMTWRYAASALRLDDNAQLNFGTDDDGDIYHDGSQMIVNNTTGTLKVRSNNLQLTRTDNEVHINCASGAQVDLYYSGNKKLETTSAGITVTGTISDSTGNVRKSYKNEQANAYTLVAGDAGKVIGAQNTITIPASVFGDGDMVTIVNYTAGNITLTQGSGLTLYNSGDASTGNKTLATRGMATVWFPAGTTAYMSGTGIS